ncbi:hypothetical protein B0H12DRAFT_538933 [Mycena haematopus]|nr:hypothetical protein B0H12DRAFT_538933 [Mycena haematopus]
MSLLAFLSEPAPPGVANPPALPPSLNNLPHQVYIDAALAYVTSYPFERSFTLYTPQKIQKKFTPDSSWQKKSRAVLKACISTDRGLLASLSSGPEPYDATKHQLNFVRNQIIDRRWTLEEVASEMRALLQLFRSRTQPASDVSTPSDTGQPREKSVVDQVRERDGDKCRLTGIEHLKKGPEAEDQEARDVPADRLQVVHCLPCKTRNTSFDLIEALAGINITGWQADSVENAFLTRTSIHYLFATFTIFFEWIRTATGEEGILIRGRTRPRAASPKSILRGLLNDRSQRCDSILDTPLRPRHDTSVADLDPKYFILHKYIGDIVWMAGGPEPVPDEDDEDEDDVKVLSDTNFGALIERLNAPEMDLLPRQREGIFLSTTELVPKDSFWCSD